MNKNDHEITLRYNRRNFHIITHRKYVEVVGLNPYSIKLEILTITSTGDPASWVYDFDLKYWDYYYLRELLDQYIAEIEDLQ